MHIRLHIYFHVCFHAYSATRLLSVKPRVLHWRNNYTSGLRFFTVLALFPWLCESLCDCALQLTQLTKPDLTERLRANVPCTTIHVVHTPVYGVFGPCQNQGNAPRY